MSRKTQRARDREYDRIADIYFPMVTKLTIFQLQFLAAILESPTERSTIQVIMPLLYFLQEERRSHSLEDAPLLTESLLEEMAQVRGLERIGLIFMTCDGQGDRIWQLTKSGRQMTKLWLADIRSRPFRL